ncbi:hypothetical protein ACH4D5_01580 [Streptomyces sp. NPDC018029]|uniref:hypothetical protein n=1 Tax=Streptomyces sp. NPDC018029 TaxID=3365032 RepID=UPI00378E5C18
MTELDPRQHLLSSRRYLRDASGTVVSQPVSFTEEAAEQRENLSGRLDDARVTITGTEALASAALLKEFAARLRHDLAHGAASSGAEELAQVTSDLAERMANAGGLVD